VAGYNHWAQVAAQLEEGLSNLAAQTAENGASNVQGKMLANGQYKTGFMHDAVYANTSRGSSYGQVGSPPGDAYLLPEAGSPTNYNAFFGCAANYSAYQNYGTRYLPARPFFEPGVEETQQDFDTGMAELAAKLGSI